MTTQKAGPVLPLSPQVAGAGASWRLSWPLLGGLLAYLFALAVGRGMLVDGDTYWHIAAGKWMFTHGAIPSVDPFSHTMNGAPWVAHEWLSELVFAAAHALGGWTLVGAITAAAFAVTCALMLRALMRWIEPAYAFTFVVLAVAMTAEHLLARPHILALPLLMAWTFELVKASDDKRTPACWMLALMVAWANLHGSFTLGLVLAGAMALESVLNAQAEHRLRTGRGWFIFLVLALAASLVTPHGVNGLLFTWHVLFNLGGVLANLGEWQSPNFHSFGGFELWLLCGIGIALYQGLRLPLVRILVVAGLLHMALKHVRYVELVGLLVPLFVSGPFAAQWKASRRDTQQLSHVDSLFERLRAPAGWSATMAATVLALSASALSHRLNPLEPPSVSTVPAQAVEAVRKADITGPVFNSYGTGGYLIYSGIPVFIDGRADMYGRQFTEAYFDATSFKTPNGFAKLLDKHRIAWTLLRPESTAVVFLDHAPGWKRLHADKNAVVHVRAGDHQGAARTGVCDAAQETTGAKP